MFASLIIKIQATLIMINQVLALGLTKGPIMPEFTEVRRFVKARGLS
jgi:hypothetical protein